MERKSLFIAFFFWSQIVVLGWSATYAQGWQQEGVASWYGGKFQGRLTANGEYFDTYELTAAHKELPFGSIVRVKNLDSGLSVDVRINDRGPFVKNRIIDLSFEAAKKIGMTGKGTANVLLTILKEGNGETFHHLRKAEKIKGKKVVSGKQTDFAAVNWIQVGAFSNQQNAIRRKNELQEKGFSSEVVEQKGLYKVGVSVTPGSNAKGVVQRLRELGYNSVATQKKKGGE